MVREAELWEMADTLPELTPNEKAAMDSFDAEAMFAEIEAQLPREQRKCWKVTDRWGNLIKRFRSKTEALASAMDRNHRATAMGLHMRYRIEQDEGY